MVFDLKRMLLMLIANSNGFGVFGTVVGSNLLL
jgi:hypothetical protein